MNTIKIKDYLNNKWQIFKQYSAKQWEAFLWFITPRRIKNTYDAFVNSAYNEHQSYEQRIEGLKDTLSFCAIKLSNFISHECFYPDGDPKDHYFLTSDPIPYAFKVNGTVNKTKDIECEGITIPISGRLYDVEYASGQSRIEELSRSDIKREISEEEFFIRGFAANPDKCLHVSKIPESVKKVLSDETISKLKSCHGGCSDEIFVRNEDVNKFIDNIDLNSEDLIIICHEIVERFVNKKAQKSSKKNGKK